MNNIIKSIHDQLKPDERVVDTLKERLGEERPAEIRTSAVKRLWLAVPAAVICVAVCLAMFIGNEGDKLVVDENESFSPDIVVTKAGSSSSEIGEQELDTSYIAPDGEFTVEKLSFKKEDNIELNSYSVASGKPVYHFPDDETKERFFEENKYIEFDGAEYTYQGEYYDGDESAKELHLGDIIGMGDNEYSSSWYVRSFSDASFREKLVIFDNTGGYSNVNYLYVNEDCGETVVSEAYFIADTFDDDTLVYHEVYNEDIKSAAFGKLGDVGYDREYYRYSGISEMPSIPDGADIAYEVDGTGYIDVRFADGAYLKMHFCVYRFGDFILAELFDGTVLRFEKLEDSDRSQDGQGGFTIPNPSDNEKENGDSTDIDIQSAKIYVDTIYSSEDEYYRNDIARVFPDGYKEKLTEKANTVIIDGVTYTATDKTTYSMDKPIGEGRVVVNGTDVSKVWFYTIDGEPQKKQIGIDFGDWECVIYDNYRYRDEGDYPEKVVLTLKEYDGSDMARPDETFLFEEDLKKYIFEKLGSIKFGGREYVWSGETLDGNARDNWIGGGDLMLDYDLYGAYVYSVKGASSEKEIIIDIGDWKNCRFIVKK